MFKLDFIKYVSFYILAVLIAHYVTIYFIGIPSLYTVSPLTVLVIHFAVLLWGVIKPLDKDSKVQKKDIFWPFIITTTVFNTIFFYFQQVDTNLLITINFVNIIEFILLRPRSEVLKGSKLKTK